MTHFFGKNLHKVAPNRGRFDPVGTAIEPWSFGRILPKATVRISATLKTKPFIDIAVLLLKFDFVSIQIPKWASVR